VTWESESDEWWGMQNHGWSGLVMTGPRNRVAFSEKRLRIPRGIKGLLACVLKIKHHWYFSIAKL
jgi:hypothetical protein